MYSVKLRNQHWNEETGRKFLDDLATKLNIRSPRDWYRVSVSTLRQHGGSRLYDKYGTLFNMFSSIYPEYLMTYILYYNADSTGLKCVLQKEDRTTNGMKNQPENFWMILAPN